MIMATMLEDGFIEQDEAQKDATWWSLLVGGKKIYKYWSI